MRRCPICNSNRFQEIIKLKYISALQSPNGKESTANLKLMCCIACETPIDLKAWMDKRNQKIEDKISDQEA